MTSADLERSIELTDRVRLSVAARRERIEAMRYRLELMRERLDAMREAGDRRE